MGLEKTLLKQTAPYLALQDWSTSLLKQKGWVEASVSSFVFSSKYTLLYRCLTLIPRMNLEEGPDKVA